MVAFTGEWGKRTKRFKELTEQIKQEMQDDINFFTHKTPGTMSWPPVVKTEEPQPEYLGPVSEDFDFIRARLDEIKKERQPKPEPEISIEPIITSGSVCRNCGYNYRVHNQECPACNDPPPKDTGDFYD